MLQDDPNGEGYAPPGGPSAGHYYPAPPPAHYRPPARQPTPVKEEPGLDMSGWSHPGYQVSTRPVESKPYKLRVQGGPAGYYRKLPPPGPGFQPFSLDANEALKVERKRARNRVAASKCR